jgi:hypothetical protein
VRLRRRERCSERACGPARIGSDQASKSGGHTRGSGDVFIIPCVIASLLGIARQRVLAVFEFVDEQHVFVETIRDYDGFRECGQRAVSGGRLVMHVRDRLVRRRPG